METIANVEPVVVCARVMQIFFWFFYLHLSDCQAGWPR